MGNPVEGERTDAADLKSVLVQTSDREIAPDPCPIIEQQRVNNLSGRFVNSFDVSSCSSDGAPGPGTFRLSSEVMS
jgi:hypothetical protein